MYFGFPHQTWRLASFAIGLMLTAAVYERAHAQQVMPPEPEPWYTPDFVMLQSAGFVGYLAAGPGWHPGDGHEVAALIGYVPASIGGVEIWQFTFKYAWEALDPVPAGPRSHWTPLMLGLSVIRGYHENLWVRQPEQYPANYYNPSGLHATLNIGTAIRAERLEFVLEFAALDRGVVAYYENPEFFRKHYAYYGLAGIGSLALSVKLEWP